MTTKGSHPHFDDGGAVEWFTTLAGALVAARAGKKRIFIEYGRQACGGCRSLVEGVIPREDVKKALRESFISVAIDCDQPDPAVRALGAAHMSHARALPFIIFTDEDGKFLEGSEGGASASSFLAALERVREPS